MIKLFIIKLVVIILIILKLKTGIVKIVSSAKKCFSSDQPPKTI